MAINRHRLWDVLKYAPHPGQQQMHSTLDESGVRRLVCLYGRRAGKTHGARFESVYQALKPADQFGPPLVYIVSDTYSHAKKLFNAASLELTTKLSPLVQRVYLSDLIVKLKTGAEIHAKSADNPASLAGDGVSTAILEESGFIDDYAIEVLMPALSERQGQALAIGTPDRPGWYKQWFLKGLAGADGHRSLQLPTSVNPYFPREELAALKRDLPDLLWRKYYMAEFVDDEGALFKQDALAAVMRLEAPEAPQTGRTYLAGVDLARSVDYTVVSIFDATEMPRRQVMLARWRAETWEVTTRRVADLLRQYNALAEVDATGVGDPIFEALQRLYPNVRAFKFTASSKGPLVESLAIAVQRQDVLFLRDDVQMAEMSALQAKSTANGVKYEAPNGMHDDIPMANALANRAGQPTGEHFGW